MNALPTPPKGATVAPVATVSPVATVAELRACLAQVTATKGANTGAVATLGALVLSRYTAAMQGSIRTLDGVRVILSSDKKAIALTVWNDAGHGAPPETASRTAGDKSLAQYISRYATVATDEGYGVDGLADTTTANTAYESIAADKRGAREDDARRAYNVWQAGLLAEDAKALNRVLTLFTTDTTAQGHYAAFARIVSESKA